MTPLDPRLNVRSFLRAHRRITALPLVALLAGCGSNHGADPSADGSTDASTSADSSSAPEIARLVVRGVGGEVASLDVSSPWTVRADTSLGADVASLRCHGLRCALVHRAPGHSVDIVDALDLSIIASLQLESDADPRDAVFLDESTILVSQYGRAELVVIDLGTREQTPIDLTEVADADGFAEPGRIAACGHRAYVQLARSDHEAGGPSELGAALAIVDVDRPEDDRIVDVDPSTKGVQPVALAARADFDMPIDCTTGRLYIAEPAPLFSGGGAYERVDLETFVVDEFAIDQSAQVGGFEVVSEALVWTITHTDFGPGASSHLNLVGGEVQDTHNTFSGYYVEDLALDRIEDLLFFPDPCVVTPSNTACAAGVHVFHATSGARASVTPVPLPFEPIDLAIAR